LQRLEPAMGSRRTPPYVGGVHHVVVDQRADVQHLQAGRGRQDRLRRIAAGGPETPVAEGRAEPLAAAGRVPRRLDLLGQLRADRGQSLLLQVEETGQRALDLGRDVHIAIHVSERSRYERGDGHRG
jgi:hypothetical protein